VRLRSSKEREERFEQSLKRTTKDYESVREQLETSKNKIAELLQSCFELGDSDLISFV
jgi:5-bromo-4-chloroindolyl phosphate hydrolysis protein